MLRKCPRSIGKDPLWPLPSAPPRFHPGALVCIGSPWSPDRSCGVGMRALALGGLRALRGTGFSKTCQPVATQALPPSMRMTVLVDAKLFALSCVISLGAGWGGNQQPPRYAESPSGKKPGWGAKSSVCVMFVSCSSPATTLENLDLFRGREPPRPLAPLPFSASMSGSSWGTSDR